MMLPTLQTAVFGPARGRWQHTPIVGSVGGERRNAIDGLHAQHRCAAEVDVMVQMACVRMLWRFFIVRRFVVSLGEARQSQH